MMRKRLEGLIKQRKRLVMSLIQRLLVLGVVAMAMGLRLVARVASHDYGDALTKSILFYEGQRSGKLPPTQRMNWRKDSALRDGFEIGVSLFYISCA